MLKVHSEPQSSPPQRAAISRRTHNPHASMSWFTTSLDGRKNIVGEREGESKKMKFSRCLIIQVTMSGKMPFAVAVLERPAEKNTNCVWAAGIKFLIYLFIYSSDYLFIHRSIFRQRELISALKINYIIGTATSILTADSFINSWLVRGDGIYWKFTEPSRVLSLSLSR